MTSRVARLILRLVKRHKRAGVHGQTSHKPRPTESPTREIETSDESEEYWPMLQRRERF